MLNKVRIALAALVASLAMSSIGCFAAAAGIVEVSRGHNTTGDPMGKDYVGTNGWIGWYQTYAKPDDAMGNLLAGVMNLRCGVSSQPGRIDANCHGGRRLAALHTGQLVYRLCPPNTDRMACRTAWEDVHNAAPRPFVGRQDDDD